MKRRACFLATALVLLTIVPSFGADKTDQIPKVIAAGMTAYKAEGPEAALRAWLKGSPIDGSREALSQSNNLRQIQDFYGNFRGFEVIRTQDLTPSSRFIYPTVDYEKGPVFAKFLVYRAETDWIVISFLFNTKPEAILPECR